MIISQSEWKGLVYLGGVGLTCKAEVTPWKAGHYRGGRRWGYFSEYRGASPMPSFYDILLSWNACVRTLSAGLTRPTPNIISIPCGQRQLDGTLQNRCVLGELNYVGMVSERVLDSLQR